MSFWSRNGASSNNGWAPWHKKPLVRLGVSALASLFSVGVAVRAQDIPPGILATFDVAQRLEYSDNPGFDEDGEADLYGRTLLDFNLNSVTKVEAFDLTLGTEIEEFQDDNDGDFNFTNSLFLLSYDRNTRNALAGVNLRYEAADADEDFSDDDFDQDGNIITQDDGTRTSYGFNLRSEVGREAPIGASFNWTYNEIRFTDTDDPDLNDSTLNDFSGQVDFDITPKVTTSLTGRYNEFNTESPTGTDRETTGLGTATNLLISRILTANAGLSYDRVERTGDTNRTDEGISGNFGLTRELPNGTVGFNYASNVFANDDGRRSFLDVERDMELPRGALAFSLGVTGADAVGTDPLASVDFRHDLPDGQITLGYRQSVVVDDDDNEDINTSLRASYDQQINSVSSYGVNVSIFDRTAIEGDGDDAQRLDLSLNYRYDLTRDWGLVSGISYAYSTEDDDEDRRRTTVFIGLQRSFSWIP